MSKLFEQKHFVLNLYVYHDEIEKLELSLNLLKSHVDIKNFEKSYELLCQIRFMINHIYQRELPLWDNLL